MVLKMNKNSDSLDLIKTTGNRLEICPVNDRRLEIGKKAAFFSS